MKKLNRVFVKIDSRNKLVPGTLIKRYKKPKSGRWIELDDDVCCVTLLAPAPPTNPITDDTANTFDWTYSPLFTTNSSYEYTLDSGATYAVVTAKPQTGMTGVRAVGTVGVRVKQVSGRPTSSTLFNTVAFS